jgi:hypothetical protein
MKFNTINSGSFVAFGSHDSVTGRGFDRRIIVAVTLDARKA